MQKYTRDDFRPIAENHQLVKTFASRCDIQSWGRRDSRQSDPFYPTAIPGRALFPEQSFALYRKITRITFAEVVQVRRRYRSRSRWVDSWLSFLRAPRREFPFAVRGTQAGLRRQEEERKREKERGKDLKSFAVIVQRLDVVHLPAERTWCAARWKNCSWQKFWKNGDY